MESSKLFPISIAERTRVTGLVEKKGIQFKFRRPSVRKNSAAQACTVTGGCEISVVADFKGIIPQVLVNEDLEIVYTVFGGGDASDEVLTLVIIYGTISAPQRKMEHCVQSLKIKKLT